MFDSEARTGRTMRMIEEAKSLHAEGRAVYVIFLNDTQAKYWEEELKEYKGLSVETVESIGKDAIDWSTLRVRYSWPNCEFLFDSVIIENKIMEMRSLFRECSRWDLPKDEWPPNFKGRSDVNPGSAHAANRIMELVTSLSTNKETQYQNQLWPIIANAVHSYHIRNSFEIRIQDTINMVDKCLEQVRQEFYDEHGSVDPDTNAWEGSDTDIALSNIMEDFRTKLFAKLRQQ